jgi:phage/plasmid-associated DNA primase
MFQHPLEPLPYLFFYGPQNTGKSTFHLAVQRLLKDGNGYKRADNALTSNFNAELEGGILCVIEETNMKKDKKAYEKIRDLVTSPQISIHPKGFTPYLVPNSTHWVQCANDFDACPAFAGDTRITMILVEPFVERMDKHMLYQLLDKEAPDFLGEILKLELPTSNDRLFVPVINTSDKQILEDSNKSMLEIFIQENCHHVPGNMIMFSDFYERFIQWCPRDEAHMWSKIKVGREIPLPYVKGRKSGSGQFHVGNMSWDGSEKPGKRLAISGDILREVLV